MEPVVLTMSAAVTALVIEASKEAGKAIVKESAGTIDRLIALIRDRFKTSKIEGILTKVQEQPNEPNKTTFSSSLTQEIKSDPDFAAALAELLKQLKKEGEPVIQEMLVGIRVEGSLEVGDMTQESTGKSDVSQKMASDITAGSIKIGNLHQKS
jgi:spore cortex formation protein SpoVR/YcgB (stage V sporulation)